jgi:transposase
MKDTDLYAQILGVQSPWHVRAVDLRVADGEVEVLVEHRGTGLKCPQCGSASSGYDTRRRRWRHLPTCQYKTILTAEVPRVRCPEHGVKTLQVPWSDPGSGFTALFEALVINWLQEASLSAVARQLDLSWDQVDGVFQRAVRRGLARRRPTLSRRLGVDETSFQRRHEYVTVVADLDRNVVHYVADGRGKQALSDYYEGFDESQREAIETVSMDMWGPYIAATLTAVPNAASKIAFDKFHVAMHLGKAVDMVRRREHRQLTGQGDETLKGTKYLWLQHPDRLTEERAVAFQQLVAKALKTSRAWMLKELAMEMWESRDRATAQQIFEAWYSWAVRSRLDPIRSVARTMKKHLYGILNAIETGVTNARLEGINTVIQWLKRSARGFRNRERFRNSIYFHLGGLDLYPHALAHQRS